MSSPGAPGPVGPAPDAAHGAGSHLRRRAAARTRWRTSTPAAAPPVRFGSVAGRARRPPPLRRDRRPALAPARCATGWRRSAPGSTRASPRCGPPSPAAGDIEATLAGARPRARHRRVQARQALGRRPRAGEVLARRFTSVQRLLNTLDDTDERLRLLDARLGATVARAAEVALCASGDGVDDARRRARGRGRRPDRPAHGPRRAALTRPTRSGRSQSKSKMSSRNDRASCASCSRGRRRSAAGRRRRGRGRRSAAARRSGGRAPRSRGGRRTVAALVAAGAGGAAGAMAAEARSITLSSSPRSSQTPRHWGQKSISTPSRDEIERVTSQTGHFMGADTTGDGGPCRACGRVAPCS